MRFLATAEPAAEAPPVHGCEEWLAARLELLEVETELTRRSAELARQRQA